ncbi:MAG TPA: hypothetical protein VNR67_06815, partial [Solirubrobacterales bacterium]|nr:hypothetical protein [Solirubrobacterales bacterium]
LPAPPPNGAPVVPLDARPQISFGRSLHDDALAGSNAQAVLPEFERIGNPDGNQGPARVRYGLKEVTLSRFTSGWQLIARSGTTPNQPGIPRLYGSWAPVPQLPSTGPDQVAQSKLTLWSRSAFDWSRHTGGRWDEWFSKHVDRYPCPPSLPPPVRRCCDFEEYETGQTIHPPFRCGSGISIDWQAGIVPAVSRALIAPTGHSRGLLFPALKPVISIALPEPARYVRVGAVDGEGVEATARQRDGRVLGPIYGGTAANPKIEFEGEDIFEVILRPYLRMNLAEVCYEFGPSPSTALEVEKVRQHLVEETARWSQSGEVLQPWTQYRLAVTTTVEAQGEGEIAGWTRKETVTELAYFRTEGPPGLGAPPSLPPGSPAAGNFDSGLTTLARYVRQTVPATVPAPGSPAPLPRPVYRGYDVGVEFDVDYVDLMYRLGQRDLVLYLFDANGRPARNAAGAVLAGANRWGRTEQLHLSASDETWLKLIDASTCATIDKSTIPHDVALASGAPDQVLAADALHEARLLPLLVRDGFDQVPVNSIAVPGGTTIAKWWAGDETLAGGPSRWLTAEEGTPPARFLRQTKATGAAPAKDDPACPGAVLTRDADPRLPAGHRDQPAQWTDVRVTAYLRGGGSGAVGLVFRHSAAGHYRFSISHSGGRRRLVRVSGGVTTLL